MNDGWAGDPFRFLSGVHEKYNDPHIERMNLRHRFIVDAHSDQIRGARVLDLASYDGRWAYAFANAGASEVVGVEGRRQTMEQFERFPDTPAKRRVSLHCGEIFAFLETLVARGERFDVVGVLGIFYHIMDHFRLLRLIQQLGPSLVIVDSEFMTDKWSFIALWYENTAQDFNAIPIENEPYTLGGAPSVMAFESMASCLGYRFEWSNWDTVPIRLRKHVPEYYRAESKRRFTCALRPIAK